MIGIRLTGTVTDLPLLEQLGAHLPVEVLRGPWSYVWPKSAESLAWPTEPAGQAALAALSVPVVELSRQGDAVTAGPVRGPVGKPAPSLAAAVRPVPVGGDPAAAEALFLLPTDGPCAPLYLERLLLLGRDDVRVYRWPEDTEHLAVRVDQPPLYLLMRARDHDDPVRVFARADQEGRVWIEWGFTHPLAPTLRESSSEATVLIDRTGHWRFMRPPASTRSIYDALRPSLPLPQVVLQPDDQIPRLEIRLQLAPAPAQDPELFLLTPEQLYDLERFMLDVPVDQLSRLMVARLADHGGRVHYVLRERMTTDPSRLGPRLASFLGNPGFAKHDALDNLYLSVGRKLRPKMRRDELRRMLALTGDRRVLLEDDPHQGPRQITVEKARETRLTDWLQLVAFDRRLTLDDLFERAVFEFPPMEVESLAAGGPRPGTPPAPRRTRAPRPVEPPAKVPPKPEPTPDATAAEEDFDTEAARAAAKALQVELAAGGVDAADKWAALSKLLAGLNERDEARFAAECAAFYGAPADRHEWVARLTALHTALDEDEVLALAAQSVLPAEHARALSMAALEGLAKGQPPPHGAMEAILDRVTDPGFAVPIRLAWLVLDAWHRFADDGLGLTRAQEAMVGRLNGQGLSEIHDLPAFVRRALAFTDRADAEDDAGPSSERLELERLFASQRFDARGRMTAFMDEALAELAFAVGLARVGSASLAGEIVERVETKKTRRSFPGMTALLRLMIARVAFESTDDDPDAWSSEVERILAGLDDAQRRPSQWLIKRSKWLRGAALEAQRALQGRVHRAVEEAQVTGHAATLDALAAVCGRDAQAPQEWEVVGAAEHLVDAAAKTGSAKGMETLLGAVARFQAEVRVPAHGVRLQVASLRGAAAVDDTGRVEDALNALARLAQSGRLPWIADVKRALRPTLSTLRRLGMPQRAAGLLDALVTMPMRTKKDQVTVRATLADGFLQLNRREEADALIDDALTAALDGRLNYVDRTEATISVFDSLRHWPAAERAARATRLLSHLEAFRDTYVMGQYFRTHRYLVIEAIVDSLADVTTRKNDLLAGFMDREEYAIRRRILADWKSICGT